MAKHKSIYIFFGVLLLGSVAAGFILIVTQLGAGSSAVKGTVFKVIDTPKGTKDGYYGISVQASNGQDYVIDATGLRNETAATKKVNQSRTCIDVPKVSAGDKVSFSLPRSSSSTNTYVVCHASTDTGYYFKVL